MDCCLDTLNPLTAGLLFYLHFPAYSEAANSPGFTSHHLECLLQRQLVVSIQELQGGEGMAWVMNEVRLGYFNVPCGFGIIKCDYWQCTCLSWMMLHLTFNDTIERGSKLVQALHFNGFPFELWQYLLALNNILVLFLLHYSSPVGSCVFENKRKKNWTCKKNQENILKNSCQMYHICMKSCLSYFVQWILFMVRYIYARDLIRC